MAPDLAHGLSFALKALAFKGPGSCLLLHYICTKIFLTVLHRGQNTSQCRKSISYTYPLPEMNSALLSSQQRGLCFGDQIMISCHLLDMF